MNCAIDEPSHPVGKGVFDNLGVDVSFESWRGDRAIWSDDYVRDNEGFFISSSNSSSGSPGAPISQARRSTATRLPRGKGRNIGLGARNPNLVGLGCATVFDDWHQMEQCFVGRELLPQFADGNVSAQATMFLITSRAPLQTGENSGGGSGQKYQHYHYEIRYLQESWGFFCPHWVGLEGFGSFSFTASTASSNSKFRFRGYF